MRRIIGSGTFYMFMFLGHAVGSYSKDDPQLRRHCGRDIDDLDDSDTPTSSMLGRLDLDLFQV